MPFVFKNKVVLVRHGQTLWNLEKRTQGHLDSPLTGLGISQAKETASKLQEYKFDLIISSPLGRALQTANLIAEELKISKIQTDPNLAERHLGVLQGCAKEESLKKYPHFYGTNNKFIQCSDIPEAETLQEFLNRTGKAVEKISEISKANNVLVVTHDGVLHAIIGHVKSIDFGEVQKSYKFEHCEPVVL